VPYRKYGGLRFLEAAHVKDFIAAGRLLGNTHDEIAWYRVLRLHRNLGPTRARILVELARPSETDALSRWPEIVAAAPASARTELSASLGGLLEARSEPSPGGRARAVLDVLRPLVESRYDGAPARLEDLERLVDAASVVDDLAVWLAELTMDPPASTGDFAHEPHLDEDYVVISTIHSAKGLEWQVVHLPHLVDGAMPIDMALSTREGLDEERRLLYVAVTRARDELHLYAPLRMPYHRYARDDRHGFAQLTRFLDESVQATLEVVEEPPVGSVVSGSASGKVVVDLDPLWA
jgi:DNA helicase-2/ATP-dependent DNA helicase PcrA